MKRITVTQDYAKKRLDIFLRDNHFSAFLITRGEIINKINKGAVLVNGKMSKPSYSLKVDDVVEFEEVIDSNVLIPNPKIKIKIIFENKEMIVVEKPAGVQIHPDAHEKQNTLVNWLVAKFPEVIGVGDGSAGSELRPGIVHRLDKDTSGVMLIARNQKSFEKMKVLFQKRKVQKKYVAIVYGKIFPKVGIIEKPLARAKNYRRQTVAGERTSTKIREAVTKYRVVREFGSYSLVELWPKTGRTHQIRIHLLSVGNPIVGDSLYKLKNIKTLVFPRHLLHAQEISFTISGKKYVFLSKIPRDFAFFESKHKNDKVSAEG